MEARIENTAYRELLDPLVCTFHVCNHRDYRLYLRFSRLNEEIGLNLEIERKNMHHAHGCPKRPQVVKNISPLICFKVSKSLQELRKKDTCSVCLAPFMVGQEVACMNCNHLHHKKCLQQWLNVRQNCPLCRYTPSHF